MIEKEFYEKVYDVLIELEQMKAREVNLCGSILNQNKNI